VHIVVIVDFGQEARLIMAQWLGAGGLSHGFPVLQSLTTNRFPDGCGPCGIRGTDSSQHSTSISNHHRINTHSKSQQASMEAVPDAQPQEQQAISKQQMTDFFQRLRTSAGLTAVMDFSCCSA
jgi:hypothetical protein